MKQYDGWLLTVCISTLAYYVQGFVEITANVSMEDGYHCPEITELTCTLFNVQGSSALRWTNSEGNLIDSLIYNFQDSDRFPREILPENRSAAFISYTILDAKLFDPSNRGLGINATGVLVINPELLISDGQSRLGCGGLGEMNVYMVDMEVPSVPQGIIYQLMYNSSQLLQELILQSSRPSYSRSIDCEYKNSSYFNVSILHKNTPVQNEVAEVSTNCSSADCRIQFPTLFLPSDSQEIRVAVSVGNRFGDSTAQIFGGNNFFPVSVQSIFAISVSYTDCQTHIECIARTTLGAGNCTILYGTNQFLINSSQIVRSVNTLLPLDGLEDATRYYIQVTFRATEGPGNNPRYFILQTEYETGTCTSSNQGVIVGVTVGVLIAVVLVTCLIVIIIIFLIRTSSRVSLTETDGRNRRDKELEAQVDVSLNSDILIDEREHCEFGQTREAAFRQAAAAEILNEAEKPHVYDTLTRPFPQPQRTPSSDQSLN